jgi:GNAT superfamily N-acetyltransferase
MAAPDDRVLRRVGPDEAKTVRAILQEAADELTRVHGEGHWSKARTVATLRKWAVDKSIHLVERAGTPIATFCLSGRKPGFYRDVWFGGAPGLILYLTEFAVVPAEQRRGVGRWCMATIEDMARDRGDVAIRFDAYAGPAGAGAFYRKCGYSLVHEGPLKLEFYEKQIR